MIRYTTPTETLIVGDVDLTDCDVYVSIRQPSTKGIGSDIVDIRNPTVTYDGTDSTIVVELTQLQTGELRVGTASIQVNWIDEYGVRKATNIVAKPIGENLLQRELEYGVDPDEEETNGQE